MKKKIVIFLLSLSIFSMMCGCGTEVSIGEDEPIDIHAMASDLQTGLTFEDSLSELNTDVGLNYYGISNDMVKDSVVILSTGATAEEIAIFEARTKDYAKVIELACNTRKEKQYVSYSDYKPEETSKLDHTIVKTNGNIIVYCVANDYKKAEQIIDGYFK